MCVAAPRGVRRFVRCASLRCVLPPPSPPPLSPLQLGERILTLAELASKLESESEQLEPFEAPRGESLKLKEGLAADAAEELQAAKVEQAAGSGTGEEDPAARMMPPPPPPLTEAAAFDDEGNWVARGRLLENFWTRYNKALLGKLVAERQVGELSAENASLGKVIKQMHDRMIVQEDAVDGDNSLLVVNGRTGQRDLPVRRFGEGAAGVVRVPERHIPSLQ